MQAIKSIAIKSLIVVLRLNLVHFAARIEKVGKKRNFNYYKLLVFFKPAAFWDVYSNFLCSKDLIF